VVVTDYGEDRKGVEAEGTHVLEQPIDEEILHGKEEKLEKAVVQLVHLHGEDELLGHRSLLHYHYHSLPW
jgi:hypothetical protein